jgi:hypothetical protein
MEYYKEIFGSIQWILNLSLVSFKNFQQTFIKLLLALKIRVLYICIYLDLFISTTFNATPHITSFVLIIYR